MIFSLVLFHKLIKFFFDPFLVLTYKSFFERIPFLELTLFVKHVAFVNHTKYFFLLGLFLFTSKQIFSLAHLFVSLQRWIIFILLLLCLPNSCYFWTISTFSYQVFFQEKRTFFMDFLSFQEMIVKKEIIHFLYGIFHHQNNWSLPINYPSFFVFFVR